MGHARITPHGRCGFLAAGLLITSGAFLSGARAGAAVKAGGGGDGSEGRGGGRGGKPTTASTESVSRLAVGSCNKQYLPQPMWSSIEDLSPDVWLWIGDAVYVDKLSDGGVEKMKEAIDKQLANEDYQRFLKKVPRVEGVWDDHDYGVNDAGKELSDHPGRVTAFLDFLGVGPDDPRRGGGTLYSSHLFGEAPKQVKVLMLDLRTQRDPYHAFNVAHRKFKFAAMIGAMLRWFSSVFCLGSNYDGSILAEDQWEWLEEQLTDSQASVHVLVSTLQVLTSNPLVESWGHFPQSRKRLLSLLHRTSPAGLIMFSGDVHHAEFASGWRASPPKDETRSSAAGPLPSGHPDIDEAVSRGGGCPFSKKASEDDDTDHVTGDASMAEEELGTGDYKLSTGVDEAQGREDRASLCAAHSGVGGGVGGEGRGVVEVTTSGMTHSCLSTHGKAMCEAYLNPWPEHRWRDDAYYIHYNFADIDIEWAEDDDAPQPARMAVTVRDEKGRPVLPVIEHFGAKPYQHRSDQRGSEDVAFLDRPPPPECVDPVLPGGCTARKVSMVVIAVLAWALSLVALGKGVRALATGMKRNVTTDVISAPSAGGAGNGRPHENGSKNGALNGTRNGAKKGS